jgi:hypothetical protein
MAGRSFIEPLLPDMPEVAVEGGCSCQRALIVPFLLNSSCVGYICRFRKISRSFSGRLVERHISVSSASDNARANSDWKKGSDQGSCTFV